MTTTHIVELDNSLGTSFGAYLSASDITPFSLHGFTAGPVLPSIIPEDEVFFWTPRWQAGERASEEDYRAGRFHTFGSVDDAIRHLLRADEPSDR